MKIIRSLAQRALMNRGYRLQNLVATFGPEFLALHTRVRDFTMTSVERQYGLHAAVNRIIDERIEGDIVECGVWRGGSSMIAALTLLGRSSRERTLYLYDTFAGMSEPTDKDVNLRGTRAQERWKTMQKGNVNTWDYAPREDVERNLASTGYPPDKIVLVEGKVEDTIPRIIPKRIALLRLDTDWYESTRHELEHLFPLLSEGGILILDDYGHWKGARDAVDEYFRQHGIRMMLHHLDYTGRIGMKL